MALEESHCAWSADDRSVYLSDPEVASSLSRTTGWTTWDSAIILLSYLRSRTGKGVDPTVVAVDRTTVQGGSVLVDISDISGKSVADISSGNGLVALGCSALGAKRVVATEIGPCVDLTRKNVLLNRQLVDDNNNNKMGNEHTSAAGCWANRVLVEEYAWGDPLPTSILESEILIICDALFISIRDGLQEQLLETIKNALVEQDTVAESGKEDSYKGSSIHESCRRTVLFVYEERICNAEQAFLCQLQGLENDFGEPLLDCFEVPEADLDLDAASAIHGMPKDIFYKPPPVRLWVIRSGRART